MVRTGNTRLRVLQACREALRKENLKVQWQQSNKRWVATFCFPRDDEALHVVPGDELVLQHDTGVCSFLLHSPSMSFCDPCLTHIVPEKAT